MIRYIHEQITCPKCGFPILKKFLIYFDPEEYPEKLQDILLYDFKINCPMCDWEKPYDREIQIITKNKELIIKTGWKKEKIRKIFEEHGIIKTKED